MTAAPNYLVDNLVTSVRNKYVNPTSQNLFQDTDVVAFLDEEMRSDIIPLINSVREEYWVANFDQQVTGAASYTIPQRAAGAIYRDIVFLDASGNEIALTRLAPEHIKATFPFGYQLPLYTFGYYLVNDQIFLYPQQAQNATGYKLRIKYMRRPNNLTLSTNCGQITTIAGSVLTLNNLDSTWTTSTTFDIIQNFPQFTSISDGQTITNINSGANQITLSSVPTGLAVGMYVCPTNMTCIPQIPYEAYPLLIQRGILCMANSLGDQTGAGLAEKRYEQLSQAFIKLLDPRVQGGTKKIINPNMAPLSGIIGAPFLR